MNDRSIKVARGLATSERLDGWADAKMTEKTVHLDSDDRALLLETRRKLEEATKLMGEILETLEILGDPEMMESIRQGTEDVKAGRVTELSKLLKEEAR